MGGQGAEVMATAPTSERIILIVDDDPGILSVLSQALRGRYVTHTADSAAKARSILEGATPDLLILDVDLSGENGLDVLAEFRRRSGAPVLMITGHGSELVAVRALNLRANGYLSKPFTMATLQTEVSRLLAEGPRPEHLAERARELIEEIYAEQLSAEAIAHRLGAKTRHLLDVFQARFGRTPMQFLREVRIRRAQDLLLATSLPVSEVAVRTGFRDVTYFDRFFKEQVGMSPGEFRRKHVPEEPSGR